MQDRIHGGHRASLADPVAVALSSTGAVTWGQGLGQTSRADSGTEGLQGVKPFPISRLYGAHSFLGLPSGWQGAPTQTAPHLGRVAQLSCGGTKVEAFTGRPGALADGRGCQLRIPWAQTLTRPEDGGAEALQVGGPRPCRLSSPFLWLHFSLNNHVFNSGQSG